MTLPLMIYLLAGLTPVFFGRISVAPFWLSVQALALGWITLSNHSPWSWHIAIGGLEILLVRAILVPHLLRRAQTRMASCAVDLMPSNLFVWSIAISLIIFAFKFTSGAEAQGLTLGVVAATVMIAFVLLAANHHCMVQLIALLFMENGLALFETLLPEPWPLPIHLIISVVYILTAALGSWLLGNEPLADLDPAPRQGDTP